MNEWSLLENGLIEYKFLGERREGQFVDADYQLVITERGKFVLEELQKLANKKPNTFPLIARRY